jgi:REP element-mobilizing transposase RayT
MIAHPTVEQTFQSAHEPDPDTFYRRRLPHWHPQGATIFVTWRPNGSLPAEALERLAKEQRLLDKQPARAHESPRDHALRHSVRLFAISDQLLISADRGPHWLRDERIAQLMVDALFYHSLKLYVLLSFVVMPNHVHVLLQPLSLEEAQARKPAPRIETEEASQPAPQAVPLRRITQSLKGYIAREANRLLQRTGQAFWQDESYDHWARDEAEIERIAAYIESDPVRSGLVAHPWEWRWSSACDGGKLTSPCPFSRGAVV